jgi:hypothetical protein
VIQPLMPAPAKETNVDRKAICWRQFTTPGGVMSVFGSCYPGIGQVATEICYGGFFLL